MNRQGGGLCSMVLNSGKESHGEKRISSKMSEFDVML